MTSPGTAARVPALRIAVIALIAAAVAVALYIYGREHTPDYYVTIFGRSGEDAIALKSLLATVVLGLAVVQVALALWIYQKLPLAGRAPKPVGIVHRTVGIAAVIITLPIAVHCLLAYGVQFSSLRVGIHSIAGCFFYGAFVAKLGFVHTRKLPGWVLPVTGGLLAVTIAVLWYSSSLWYYNGFSLPSL